MCLQGAIHILVVLALVPTLTRINAEVSSSVWSGPWECAGGRCVKTEVDDNRGTISLEQVSQAVCRLHCGDFGALWPRPTAATYIGKKVVSIDPGRIYVDVTPVGRLRAGPHPPSGVSAQIIVQEATRSLESSFRRMCDRGCIPGDHSLTLVVNITSADHRLDWDSDESYRLDITTYKGSVRAQILATTAWGARHGIQTVSQLIVGSSIPNPRMTPGSTMTMLVSVSEAHIKDAPRYPHRGVLLDSARHFLPLSTLLRTVDGMAASKLNVLHWHVSDSHSFPLLLPSVPQLAKTGAYSPKEIYTPATVSRLLRYARVRGVRVILELDSPAHCSAGWTWGEAAGVGPLVLCAAQQPWRQYCIQPPCGQLNPANPMVYTVLKSIYRDVMKILPRGETIHLGGDEVYFPCWNSSSEVLDYLKGIGLGQTESDFLYLWGQFHAGALSALDQATGSEKTTVILWSSHLTRPPNVERYLDPNRYVIETWTDSGDPLPEQLLARGYRIIVAAKDAWYLDHGWWGRTTYTSWMTVRDKRLPVPSGAGNVLGGEVALWGELADAVTIDGKLWPRAAAAAERFWTDPDESSSAPGVNSRLLAHRERLVEMGIAAETVSPQWCQLHDGECS